MTRHLAIVLASCVLLISGCRNNEGMTPLLLAAHSGDDTKIAALIVDGASVDETSRYGWTGLLFAASYGHKDVVNQLLHAGSDPNIVSKSVRPGFMATRGGYPPTTALREAIKNQHYDIANLLLDKGANVDPVAFALAGTVGNIPLMQRCLKLGADINASTNEAFNKSPLFAASGAGKLEAVQWLIENGADINAAHGRQTALRQAVYYDHVEIVEYLLGNGADPNLVFNSMNDTALYVAATKHTHWRSYSANLEIIRILLNNGADRSHRAYRDRTALETVSIQRANTLEHLSKVEDPEIQERHKASLDHKDSVINLLTPK